MIQAPTLTSNHRRWRTVLVDELIECPDVWARIAEHAEVASAQAGTAYQRHIAAQLAICARALAGAR